MKEKRKRYTQEFKDDAVRLVEQLKAGVAWCQSLQSIIKFYTGHSKRFYIRKYLFSCISDSSGLVDEKGYLIRDHSIKHYHYDDLKGLSLEDLENTNVEKI